MKTTKKAAAAPAVEPKRTRKLDTLVNLLMREEGADLLQMTSATGWQAHSVRGALAGMLKKKGHAIASTKEANRRVYRIVAGDPA